MKQPEFIQRLKARLDRFGNDQGGAVTMEFVIAAPLLIAWGVGSFLYYDAYRSLSQTNKVGYTIADIASRYEQIEEDDLDELESLASRMLPFRNTDHRLRISSICFFEGDPDTTADDEYRVQWSKVRNPGQLMDSSGQPMFDLNGLPIPIQAPLEDSDLPDDLLPLMADQDSVLYVELYSTWWPLSTKFMPVSSKTWYVDLMTRPRFVTVIPIVELDGDGNVISQEPEDLSCQASVGPVT